MGFATNSLGLPALAARGALVLSDENNHASLILGLRLAGAAVRVFRHNDLAHLERLARDAVAEGTWTKIIIVSYTLFVLSLFACEPSVQGPMPLKWTNVAACVRVSHLFHEGSRTYLSA